MCPVQVKFLLGKLSYLIFCGIYFLYIRERDQAIAANRVHLSAFDGEHSAAILLAQPAKPSYTTSREILDLPAIQATVLLPPTICITSRLVAPVRSSSICRRTTSLLSRPQ